MAFTIRVQRISQECSWNRDPPEFFYQELLRCAIQERYAWLFDKLGVSSLWSKWKDKIHDQTLSWNELRTATTKHVNHSKNHIYLRKVLPRHEKGQHWGSQGLPRKLVHGNSWPHNCRSQSINQRPALCRIRRSNVLQTAP